MPDYPVTSQADEAPRGARLGFCEMLLRIRHQSPRRELVVMTGFLAQAGPALARKDGRKRVQGGLWRHLTPLAGPTRQPRPFPIVRGPGEGLWNLALDTPESCTFRGAVFRATPDFQKQTSRRRRGGMDTFSDAGDVWAIRGPAFPSFSGECFSMTAWLRKSTSLLSPV